MESASSEAVPIRRAPNSPLCPTCPHTGPATRGTERRMCSNCGTCRPWRRSQRCWLRADLVKMLEAELPAALNQEESSLSTMDWGFQAQPPLLHFGILLQAFHCLCGEGSLPVARVARAEEA